MKKIILAALLATGTLAFAQRIQKGESQINAGVGFGSNYGVPVYVGFDHGVHPDITVGAQASFASKNYSSPGYNDFKGSWFGIGINANYHFNTLLSIPNNWDVYAGATLAYNSFTYYWPNNSEIKGFAGSSSGVGFAGQVGARYYFTDKFGLNIEWGGGTVASGGKFGISYKL